MLDADIQVGWSVVTLVPVAPPGLCGQLDVRFLQRLGGGRWCTILCKLFPPRASAWGARARGGGEGVHTAVASSRERIDFLMSRSFSLWRADCRARIVEPTTAPEARAVRTSWARCDESTLVREEDQSIDDEVI